MKVLRILLIGIIVMTSTVMCVEEEDNVLVLTDDNFDEVIEKHQFILVEFYAPWCGHCKQLTPEYAKAAKTLKESEGQIPLAKVDATEQKELASRFEIQGFPTLKFFINQSPIDYNGGRTADEIVAWVNKKTGPATRTLSSVSEVEAFAAENDVVVVFLGEHDTLSTFEKVAISDETVTYGVCSAAECLTHFGLANGNVVLLKNFDEKRNDLTEALTEEKLTTFVKSNKTATIMKFNQQTAQYIFGEQVPGVFLYRDPNSEDASRLEQVFNDAAPQIKSKIQLVITGITEELEPRLAEYVGIKEEHLPTVRIHDTKNDLRNFTLEGEITVENIVNFVNSWANGEVKPVLKSDEVPETQDEPVYVLVGKSFDQVVLDFDKDVLVEFYAPWCGHCKQLAPIYDELATKLKHNEHLIIAKMDSTTNETNLVSIQGFPTIKFFAANNKTPVDYDGERTLQGFVDFLKENTHFPITENASDEL